MFSATLNATVFQQIVKAVKPFFTEITFVFSAKGLMARQLAPTKVLMLELNLSGDEFLHYDWTGEDQPCQICLLVNDLVKVSKRITKDDQVILTLPEEQEKPTHLEIKLRGLIEGLTGRTFRLQLLTADSLPPAPSKTFQYTAKAYLSPQLFKRAVQDIGAFSNYIVFHAEPNQLHLTGKSENDTNTVEVTLQPDVLIVEQPTTAMYSMDYMTDLAKIIPTSKQGHSQFKTEIHFQFKTDNPLQLTFPIDWPLENSSITFLLAPRVERYMSSMQENENEEQEREKENEDNKEAST